MNRFQCITMAIEDMSPSVGLCIDVVKFQRASFDLCVILTDETIEQSAEWEV